MSDMFVCPNCGESVPQHARVCPECGSDEETGWSDQTYLDGIDLPEETDRRSIDRERMPGRTLFRTGLYALVGALLLALVALGLIRSLL